MTETAGYSRERLEAIAAAAVVEANTGPLDALMSQFVLDVR